LSVPAAVVGVESLVHDPEYDWAPREADVARETQGLPAEAQGARRRDTLVCWAGRFASRIEDAIEVHGVDVLIAALFGSAAGELAARRCGLPWVAVNSSFFVGPGAPRPLEQDFGPRTWAIARDYFGPNLNRATVVMHATDREFDFGFRGLPAHHHYVGPLFWEPSSIPPAYVEEPGPPWVLATLSSMVQDDLPIAQASILAFAELPVRVLVTVGEHARQELGPIPANARVEPYVPHGPVLERGVLMVAHAGHGAVMKALWHGVPMVLVPWARDQAGVAARAERLGVAAVVPRAELTIDSLATAVHRVQSDPSSSSGRAKATTPAGPARASRGSYVLRRTPAKQASCSATPVSATTTETSSTRTSTGSGVRSSGASKAMRKPASPSRSSLPSPPDRPMPWR
jgi:Glycosyltransferase family 28 C-terminal domain